MPVEAQTLRKLGDIRRAIAGEVQDAESLGAVRAALTRLFEGFVVYVPKDARDGDDGRIESIVRPEAIVAKGEDEELRPVLCRELLSDATNNSGVGFTT
jgi:hypothetical protein